MKVLAYSYAKLKGGGYQDIRLKLDMPFIPVNQLLVMLPAHGAYREVNSVFWNAEKPDLIEIYFDEDGLNDLELPTLKQATTMGWEVA